MLKANVIQNTILCNTPYKCWVAILVVLQNNMIRHHTTRYHIIPYHTFDLAVSLEIIPHRTTPYCTIPYTYNMHSMYSSNSYTFRTIAFLLTFIYLLICGLLCLSLSTLHYLAKGLNCAWVTLFLIDSP